MFYSNVFPILGTPPSIEEKVSDYPHVVTQNSGEKVLVVQDYAFGKYLGYLKVTFSDSGEVLSWSGNPIILDKTVERGKVKVGPYTKKNINLLIVVDLVTHRKITVC